MPALDGDDALHGMTDADLARYLDRIGLAHVGPATPDLLAQMQAAHLRAFVFEGIDPLLGRTPSLAWRDLCAKLLEGGRGGYCFELNTLYTALLARCGFAVRRVMARVRQRAPRPGARTHLALLVEASGEIWLTDVGFGGPAPRHPLRLTPGPQTDPNGIYRIAWDGQTAEHVLERQDPAGWHPLYSFDESHVTDGDVAAANHLCATWDQTPFPSNLMVTGYDGSSRLGVFNRALSEDGPDGIQRRDLTSVEDLADVFARLGLKTPADMTARIWARLP